MANLAKSVQKLFVYNLPWTVNTFKLRHHFGKFGQVASANVVFDKNTGLSRGYGFIVFTNQIACDAATNTEKHLLEVMDLVSEDDLKSRFSSAADFLPSIIPLLKPDKLLQFYGLYKQSTIGKCNTPKPNWYALQAKQKWEAWNNLGDLSQDDAMRLYVSNMSELAPDWETSDKRTSGYLGWASVSRMKDSDSDLDDDDKDIFDRVKESNIEKVRSFAEHENINIQDDDGIGLLHWAADRGNIPMVKCLVELGAEIDMRDKTGQTALHYACFCGHKDVVQYLIEESADVNVRCDEGYLPIDIADGEEIKTLIKAARYS